MCGICSTLGVNLHGDSARYSVGVVNGPMKDAASFQSTFDWETSTGVQTHISDLIGSKVRDKIVLAHGANVPGTVAWQLDSGWTLNVGSDGIITYAFFNGKHAVGLNNNPGFGEGAGYTPFTEAQKTAARIAFANWDDLIAPDFQEITGPGSSEYAKADILLQNTTTGPAQAWAYYPGYPNQYKKVAGDVWIADPRYNTSNSQFLPGQYGLHTLNHELGHSLGLSHPGNYNFSDDKDGDGKPDPITYQGDAFYFQDSHQFSIMSYFDAYETGAQNIDWNLMRFVYPSTPMVDDVFVVQQKYGAEMNTRTLNTTYGFNATSDVTNEAMIFRANEMFSMFTIWDAAGNDTLDLSGYHTPSVIDLREGAYSSAGGWGAYNPALIGQDPTLTQINANNKLAKFGDRSAALFDYYFTGVAGVNEGISWKTITGTGSQYLMEQNIGIAYGAIIENAIGGHGADRINGNQANNTFRGNGGADTFVIADYSGVVADPTDKVDWSKTVDDESVDTILDFDSGVDKIDLSELRDASGNMLDMGDLTLGADGKTWTVERGADDLSFIVLGEAAVASDFYFG